jgi:hypothetical protein
VTKEEIAEQIAKLADDGFNATYETFQNIATETIQEFSDIRVIKKFGSVARAFEMLIRIVRTIQSKSSVGDVENESSSESAVDTIFIEVPMVKEGKVVTGPEYSYEEGKAKIIGERVQKTSSPPNIALKGLIRLAKQYRIVSILAKQLEQGLDTYDQLYMSAYDVQTEHDNAIVMAYKYKNDFKPLEERNHLRDIMLKLTQITKLMKGGTTVRRP